MYYVAMLGKNLVISCLNTYRVSIHLNECCTFQRIKPLLIYSCVDPDIFTGGSESYLSFPGGGGSEAYFG